MPRPAMQDQDRYQNKDQYLNKNKIKAKIFIFLKYTIAHS